MDVQVFAEQVAAGVTAHLVILSLGWVVGRLYLWWWRKKKREGADSQLGGAE